MPLTPVIHDTEVYRNYFLAAFKSVNTGKVSYVEARNAEEIDRERLKWLLKSHQLIGFNNKNYDIVICWMAALGYPIKVLKRVSDLIILKDKKPWDIESQFEFRLPKLDYIDLIEPTPGVGISLKIYTGRLHMKRMQELPVAPDKVLSTAEMDVTRDYCINSDIPGTEGLFHAMKQQLELRERMGKEYGVDLRSKSEAQVAEAVIKARLQKLTGEHPTRPTIKPGTTYKYPVPSYLVFHTPMMKRTLEAVRDADFVVSAKGSITLPKELEGRKIRIGSSVYRMGIGGLHSSEESVSHVADNETVLIDRDVASYYPAIVLTLGLYPKHLGPSFLKVYRDIVRARLEAKRAGNKVVADSLKIVINGTFGKFGNRYSALYSPDLMIRVTVTGQLALLMLIERLELAGIHVISANTDGIVSKVPKRLESLYEEIVAGWEYDTGFETEETRYKALYSRDVNAYIAVKPDGKVKTKGAYSNPWWDKAPDPRGQFMTSPKNTICIEAVVEFLTNGAPIEQTIRSCRDVRKFVTVIRVTGGAMKDGKPLGKVIRFIHSTRSPGPILYAKAHPKTGNHKMVSKSDGARALMVLPDELPDDIDFDWYVAEAYELLHLTGYEPPYDGRLLDMTKRLGIFN